jgi:hypothetical protein
MAYPKMPIGERLFPTTHNTLAKIRDAGLHLYGYCFNPDCRWEAVVELDRLIETLGPDQSALQPNLVPKLHCPKCKSKEIAIELTATEVVPASTAAYLRKNR